MTDSPTSNASLPRAKRALLIGIDRYPRIPNKDLDGCVNDAELMRRVLVDTFAFPPGEVTLLRDGHATRQGILTAFADLTARTQAGDVVVIYYAGHGSQIPDLEGDEPSGWDSTLVPHDSAGWLTPPDEQHKDISDDEIAVVLDALGAKTRFITLIVDSCHSGTISRDVSAAKTRSLKRDERSKDELRTMRPPLPTVLARPTGPSRWVPTSENYVLIAGCRDEEESHEFGVPGVEPATPHGALTWFLSRQLLPSGPATTYRDVFERAAAAVTSSCRGQHPQMEGRTDRVVFGVRDIEPARFVRVESRDASLVTLAAGAVHGVTVGSLYAVHVQGAKTPAPGTLLGEIQVTAVSALTAEARIDHEHVSNGIETDTRAFETVHAFGDFRLRVALVADSTEVAATLCNTLGQSSLLDVVESGAALTVWLLPERDAVVRPDQTKGLPGDPVWRAGVLRAPMWAVTDECGDLVMPLKVVGEAQSHADILASLEAIARYRHALELDNPASALTGTVTLKHMRVDSSGTSTEATPDEGGRVVFDVGDGLAWQVTHTHAAPMFVSLVYFSANHDIDLLFPDGGGQVLLHPNVPLKIDGGKRPFVAAWPSRFPSIDAVDLASDAECTEVVKLFVTEKETNFSVLQQKGVRGLNSSLGNLLNRVFQGSPTRAPSRAEPIETDWTTVQASLVIRRRAVSKLSADRNGVELGAATIVTEGLTGSARTYFGRQGRSEASALLNDNLRAALQASGVEERQTLEITDAQEIGSASRGGAQPALELKLPDSGPLQGQMVLAVDELGVLSWHVAALPHGSSRGAGTRRTYVIPRPVPTDAPEGGASRGSLGILGRKVLKELVFPLLDPVLGEVGAMYVHRLEQKKWPYRLRTFQPDDFNQPSGRDLVADDFTRLSSGRALLFVHGTFSRAHTAFGKLPAEYIAELHRQYDGRVFAFEHHTVTHDPKENVKRFLREMPHGTRIDVDIICHSRGGLVSRLLAERSGDFSTESQRVNVHRVVFVGAPNAGTPLADPTRLGDLVDVFTNMLAWIPDNGVTDYLELLISVLKGMAVGTLKGLDGLQAMCPEGEFTRQLNAASRTGSAKYFAVTSNAAPVEPGLKRLLVAKGMRTLMGGNSDLVVPTDGVFAANGSTFFPIEREDTLMLDGSDGVPHTRYFELPKVHAKMLEWLAN